MDALRDWCGEESAAAQICPVTHASSLGADGFYGVCAHRGIHKRSRSFMHTHTHTLEQQIRWTN